MDDVHRRLTANIRRIAREKNLVLSHLPDLAGVSQSGFWRIMKGENSPSLGWIVSIARALEVDVVDLLRPTKR